MSPVVPGTEARALSPTACTDRGSERDATPQFTYQARSFPKAGGGGGGGYPRRLPSSPEDFCCCRWCRQRDRRAGRQDGRHPVRLLAKVAPFLLWESPHDCSRRRAADCWQPDPPLSKHIARPLNVWEIIFVPGFYALVVPWLLPTFPIPSLYQTLQLGSIQGGTAGAILRRGTFLACGAVVDGGIHLALRLLYPSLSLCRKPLAGSPSEGTEQGERRSEQMAGIPTPQDGDIGPSCS